MLQQSHRRCIVVRGHAADGDPGEVRRSPWHGPFGRDKEASKHFTARPGKSIPCAFGESDVDCDSGACGSHRGFLLHHPADLPWPRGKGKPKFWSVVA